MATVCGRKTRDESEWGFRVYFVVFPFFFCFLLSCNLVSTARIEGFPGQAGLVFTKRRGVWLFIFPFVSWAPLIYPLPLLQP